MSDTKQVRELLAENAWLQQQLRSLEARTDTVFCSNCPERCNREKIVCAMCHILSPSEANTRMKVFISSPFNGDGSDEARKNNRIKAIEYARKAWAEGYEPVVPHLYFPIFIDETEEGRKYGLAKSMQLLVDVAVNNGYIWICADETNSDGMGKEINMACALGMVIKYKYDHPKASNESSPDPYETTIGHPSLPSPMTKESALTAISAATTEIDVKRIEKEAKKDIPKDYGVIRAAASTKIRSLRNPQAA